MSSLFDKAIADAKDLKETALKNAEHLIIEKYSSELKETIEDLLEADEEEELDMALDTEDTPAEDEELDMGAGEEGEMDLDMGPPELGAGEESLMAQVPDAPTVALAQALEDDQDEVVIEFDELMADYEASTPEDMAMEVPPEEEASVDRDELLGTEEEEIDTEMDAMMGELSEEQLATLLEEVDVDIDSLYPSNGWAGSTKADKRENEDLVALGVALEEEKEKNKDLQKEHIVARANLQSEKRRTVRLAENLKETKKNLAKAKSILKEMQSKIGEANLRNAKLFYTTKVLETQELNTRQKNRIVESLAKAKTCEETKLVYETLKESVGSTKQAAPKSLVETVNRTRSLVLSSRKQEEKTDEASTMYEHWKKLAGINKP
tara:strand:+ start:8727 stop:9863 length:1137 start_codon:yes stop_codon:yes gene_type:complete